MFAASVHRESRPQTEELLLGAKIHIGQTMKRVSLMVRIILEKIAQPLTCASGSGGHWKWNPKFIMKRWIFTFGNITIFFCFSRIKNLLAGYFSVNHLQRKTCFHKGNWVIIQHHAVKHFHCQWLRNSATCSWCWFCWKGYRWMWTRNVKDSVCFVKFLLFMLSF